MRVNTKSFLAKSWNWKASKDLELELGTVFDEDLELTFLKEIDYESKEKQKTCKTFWLSKIIITILLQNTFLEWFFVDSRFCK